MAPATTPPRFLAAHLVRAALAIGLAVAIAWAHPRRTAAENDSNLGSHELQECVDALGSDSFHRRQAAARKLRDWAMQSSDSGDAVVAALRLGLEDPSMETRIAAKRLLQTLELSRFDHQIDQLLNPRVPPAVLTIAGWKSFSEMAGSDLASRSLFSRIALRHSEILRKMESPLVNNDSLRDVLPDPYAIRSDDAVSWALTLLSDAHGNLLQPTAAFSKITVALSSSAMGPNIGDSSDAVVVGRMISHWLGAGPSRGTVHQRILIAMRYSCDERASELCDQVLSDAQSLPTSQVTAMLAAVVLRRPNLRSQLEARLADDRTAHVWQLIGSSHTRIRTQVRDVALALMLHLDKIDPRRWDSTNCRPIRC